MKNMNLRRFVVWMFTASVLLFMKNAQAMDFPEINAEQLKAKMEAGEKLLLINPLSDIEFNEKHIPGSVNIPLQNILITEKLPKDKDQLIITYCKGRKCIYSTEAANLLAKRGYTKIMVFRDGIPGWENAGFATTSTSPKKDDMKVPVIEPAQLHKTLDEYLVVDIRPASAYKMGYLPGSRAMPMPYLSMLSVELPKDRRILVVDHSGKQSKRAAQWLMSNGFKDVSMLNDGVTGYINAGFELEK